MSAAPGRRGRRPAGEDTKGIIAAAARAEFALKGYEAASLRAIARAAGVDAALVHHYFAGKAALFAEVVVRAPVDPARVVDGILAGPREALGERLVRGFLGIWDEPSNQERFIALATAALTNDHVADLMRSFLATEVVGRITRETGIADAELRGGLAVTQIMGLAVVRYGIRVPSVSAAAPDDLVRWLGPVLQRYLVD